MAWTITAQYYNLLAQSNLVKYNKVALSKLKQTAMGTHKNFAAGMICELTFPDFAPVVRRDDRDRMNGCEYPTYLQRFGQSFNLNINHTGPDKDLILLLAGAAAGSSTISSAYDTVAYMYNIHPAAMTTRRLPMLTGGYRFGNNIGKMRALDLMVASLKLTQPDTLGSYMSLTAQLRGSGAYTVSPTYEIFAGTEATTAITLVGTLKGSTAQTYADSIIGVFFDTNGTGMYDFPCVLSTTDPTSQVITITAPVGETGSVAGTNFMVIYIPAETGSGELTGFDWCAELDALALPTEAPWQLYELSDCRIGGTGSVSAADPPVITYTGGTQIGINTTEIKSRRGFGGFSFTITNPLDIRNDAGGSGDYADDMRRGTQMAQLEFSHEMNDWLKQEYARGLRKSSFYAKFQSTALLTGAAATYQTLEILIPLMKWEVVSIADKNGYMVETVVPLILDDQTNEPWYILGNTLTSGLCQSA